MSDSDSKAPLANLATIVPPLSLEPTPSEQIPLNLVNGKATIVTIQDPELSEKSTLEVKFRDQDLSSSNRDSIDSLSFDDESLAHKPKIPDGGWGWMVVFSSLILSLIQDGISFSFGLLYVEFIDEFQASSSATSWIGSLFLSVPLLTGPVMSALVDKYGCRKMTLLGGLVATTGFILSSFVKTISLMYITFGILSGLGLGLTYITAVVSIAFWFDKKRNLAVGLGACGTGIGTFVYAPFTTFLLDQFGWRGTLVLLSGTLLNICVCGALMRDPDWIVEQDKSRGLSKSSRSSTASLVSSPSGAKVSLSEVQELLKSGKDVSYLLQALDATIVDETLESGQKFTSPQSVLNLPTFVRQNETVPFEVLEQLKENKKLYKIILENYPSLLSCRSTSDKGLNKLVEDASKFQRVPVTLSFKVKKTPKPKSLTHQFSLPEAPAPVDQPLLPATKKVTVVSGKPSGQMTRTGSTPWLVRQFSTTNPPHQNYFKNMRFPRHSLIHRGAILNKNKYKLRASSCPNIYKVSMATIAREEEEDDRWHVKALNTVKELFDFSLFLEYHFFVMSLSTTILFAWFMTPYFYLADHMTLSGYSKAEASYVMSTIGVTNTIGMVALGWAGDQPWANVTKTYATCLILCGIFCSAMVFFTMNYILLMISAALYGVTLASSFSFTPIILVELLPLETFTKAYGLTLLCQGIGHLGGPPIAGFLKDYTEAWEVSFHLSAVWIIVSGLLILLISYTKNRKIIGSGLCEKELANEK